MFFDPCVCARVRACARACARARVDFYAFSYYFLSFPLFLAFSFRDFLTFLLFWKIKISFVFVKFAIIVGKNLLFLWNLWFSKEKNLLFLWNLRFSKEKIFCFCEICDFRRKNCFVFWNFLVCRAVFLVVFLGLAFVF